MPVLVHVAEYRDIEPLRERYRSQIIHDSIVRRGLANPYLIETDDRVAARRTPHPRMTREKAGHLPCGRLLVGRVAER
jgi:hypothetical protein